MLEISGLLPWALFLLKADELLEKSRTALTEAKNLAKKECSPPCV